MTEAGGRIGLVNEVCAEFIFLGFDLNGIDNFKKICNVLSSDFFLLKWDKSFMQSKIEGFWCLINARDYDDKEET